MKKCVLVMTDSDLVSKLYDDDEISGKYANPMCVAENISNPTFLGWEVPLSEVPTVGDHISLSPVTGSLIKQWIEKLANKDDALCYFLDMVKNEPKFSTYWRDSSGEKGEDTEVITRILCGVDVEGSEGWNYSAGLFDGSMVVDKRFFVPGCDSVVLAVKHSL